MKIVQLGAAVGNDHVTELVKSIQNVELLLLVEPNPKVQDKLKDCYQFLPTTRIEQVAIVPNYDGGKEQTMFFAERDSIGGYQVTSLVKNHLEMHSYVSEEIESFVTRCVTLQELFEKHHISTLDYLFVDIESMDEEVILGLDLNKYDIKNICIEVIHLKNPDTLYSFLQKHGYVDKGTVNMYDRMFTKQSPKTYQICMFYNELDLLELQLEQNFDYVDKFVIVESTKTHSGHDKQLVFKQNIDRFNKYKDKIIHLVCSFDSELFKNYVNYQTNMSDQMSDPWKRETFQRDYPIISNEINFNNDDILIVVDIDEIVNMKSVSKFLSESKFITDAYKLEMYFMHYYMDTSLYLEDSGMDRLWYHPFLVKYSDLKKYNNSFSYIRTHTHNEEKIIRNSGWHFSYLMDLDGIVNKVKSFAHCDDEFAKNITHDKIKNSITNFDLFYSTDVRLKLRPFPKHLLPSVVQNNLELWGKYLLDYKKNILIIGCYLDTEIKKEVLRKNLKTLKNTFDILLVSHHPIDAEFQQLAKYIIYDSNNDVVDSSGGYNWIANKDIYMQHHPESFIDPSYAVYQLIRTPLPFIKMLGYDSFFFMEGDLFISDRDVSQLLKLKAKTISDRKSAYFFNKETTSTPWWDCQLFYSEIDFFLSNTPTLLSLQQFRQYSKQVGADANIESLLYHLLYFTHTHKVLQLQMSVDQCMVNSQLNITTANITKDNNTNLIEVGYYDEIVGKFIKFTIHILKLVDTDSIFLVYKGYDNLYPLHAQVFINGHSKLTINNTDFMYQEITTDETLFDVKIVNNGNCLKSRIVNKKDVLDSPDFIKLS
jgi:beta-1,4-mannosyl-glycoprotein beta-1,4-N-acetylglucosaminyltransferase